MEVEKKIKIMNNKYPNKSNTKKRLLPSVGLLGFSIQSVLKDTSRI